jgi:hypothetical protein
LPSNRGIPDERSPMWVRPCNYKKKYVDCIFRDMLGNRNPYTCSCNKNYVLCRFVFAGSSVRTESNVSTSRRFETKYILLYVTFLLIIFTGVMSRVHIQIVTEDVIM